MGMLVVGVVGYGSFLIVILGIASFSFFFLSLFRLVTGHHQGFSALLCAGVLWLWFSGIRLRPDDARDYSTITGTLISADEKISTSFTSRSGHLDIRLQGIKMCYRVPSDGYLDCFRREAFFAEVSKGTTVQLTALKSDIAEPGPFLTVFVMGVRADGRDYCVEQNHIARQRREKWFRLTLAMAGSAILVFNFVSTRRWREKAEKAHESTVA